MQRERRTKGRQANGEHAVDQGAIPHPAVRLACSHHDVAVDVQDVQRAGQGGRQIGGGRVQPVAAVAEGEADRPAVAVEAEVVAGVVGDAERDRVEDW